MQETVSGKHVIIFHHGFDKFCTMCAEHRSVEDIFKRAIHTQDIVQDILFLVLT